MRRALLCVLAAAVVVVAGWSAVTSHAAPRTGPGSLAVQPEASEVDALGGADGGRSEALTRSVVLGSGSTPVVLKAGAPVASTIVQRDGALIAGALVVLAALLFLVGTRPRWFRTRSTGRWPRSAPPLQAAPRRGPPVGLARPSGI